MELPDLIDQEGGRVQRLKPPVWPQYKPMQSYGDSGDYDALRADTAAIAHDLTEIGVNVNCAPCLDVLTPETHSVIGDRAFSNNPQIVAELGQIVCNAYLENGITPIVKHLPGHGRATADSHLELPVVDADLKALTRTDFVPFEIIKDPRVWAMTAHVIYNAIDADHPVSVSDKGIKTIRDDIGFNGVVVSDDLAMKALDQYGASGEKAVKVLDAGCDIALHCNGKTHEMEHIAQTCPKLRDDTLERLQNWQNSATLIA